MLLRERKHLDFRWQGCVWLMVRTISAPSRTALYRCCHASLMRFSKPGCGTAHTRWIVGSEALYWRTTSAATMSTPQAVPLMNVCKPSSMALLISRSNSTLYASSLQWSFSGRCPVKQHRCFLFSASVNINHYHHSILLIASLNYIIMRPFRKPRKAK